MFVHSPAGVVAAVPATPVGVLPAREGLPQWAVVGDNFPLGCRFDEAIVFHEYFAANPDTQDPRFNTKVWITWAARYSVLLVQEMRAAS